MIELDGEAGRRRDPRIPWVYVGSSVRPPEERWEQHRRGYKSARIVRHHGLRLRPDLYSDLQGVKKTGEAVEAEQGRARELAAAGFVAHCDGTSYGEGSGDWREWDLARVMQVREHLDAAISELYECSFRPLTVERCARLLWGAREFWVRELLDQEDPPPAYGMFAHVSVEALEHRTAELMGPHHP